MSAWPRQPKGPLHDQIFWIAPLLSGFAGQNLIGLDWCIHHILSDGSRFCFFYKFFFFFWFCFVLRSSRPTYNASAISYFVFLFCFGLVLVFCWVKFECFCHSSALCQINAVGSKQRLCCCCCCCCWSNRVFQLMNSDQFACPCAFLFSFFAFFFFFFGHVISMIQFGGCAAARMSVFQTL